MEMPTSRANLFDTSLQVSDCNLMSQRWNEHQTSVIAAHWSKTIRSVHRQRVSTSFPFSLPDERKLLNLLPYTWRLASKRKGLSVTFNSLSLLVINKRRDTVLNCSIVYYQRYVRSVIRVTGNLQQLLSHKSCSHENFLLTNKMFPFFKNVYYLLHCISFSK